MPCQGFRYGYDYGDDGIGASERADRLEKAICRTRWLLLTIVREHVARPLPPKIRSLVDREQAAQLAHRRADRKALVDSLTTAVEDVQDRIREIRDQGGMPGAKLLKRLRQLRADRAAARAIPDETLLRECWASEPRRTDLH